MLTAEVRQTGQLIKFAEGWNELTLEQFIKLKDFEHQNADLLKTLTNDDREGIDEIYLQMLDFMAGWLAIIGNVGVELMLQVKAEVVQLLFERLSVFFGQPDETRIDKFKHNGQVYYLPKEWMSNSTYGDYINQKQLEFKSKALEEGDYSTLPYMIALICKQKNEEETLVVDVVEKRAKEFLSLPMSLAYQVFFCLGERSKKWLKTFLISSGRGTAA